MKANFKKIAVISAIVIIPLAYSFMYLYAFWNPYNKLDKVPVAVVSLDKGAVINGEYENIGNDIIADLKNNDDLKWEFVSEEEAETGLEGQEYYASIIIPENFSEEISTASSLDHIKGLIEYKNNEKRNFLAGQVINRVALELKINISEKISQEISDALVAELRNIPDKLSELGAGLKEIENGTTTLYEKTGDLINGQRDFNQGLSSLSDGLSEASAGSDQLVAGADTLFLGTKTFNEALEALNLGGVSLSQGSESFSKGLAYFGTNLNSYVGGVSQYVAGVNQSSEAIGNAGSYIENYIAAHPEALADPNMQQALQILQEVAGNETTLEESGNTLINSGEGLKSGSSSLNENYADLNSGIKTITSSIDEASQQASQLYAGAEAVDSGLKELSEGIKEGSSGASVLKDNSFLLYSGENLLRSGIGELNKGVASGSNDVLEAVSDAESKTATLNGIEEYIADPVDLDTTKINAVPDYGSGFAPYFISLSLWVGALMMFFAVYLDDKYKFKISGSKGKNMVRYLSYSFVGVAQAVVLAFVLRSGLKLTVQNVPIFYLTCILISLVFIEIMRFLIVHIGEVGKFIALLLLIIQLTACGGTFPMETLPTFFQKVNPYLPMTYSVNILREIISGTNYTYYFQNLYVLLGMGLLFLFINLIALRLKENRKPLVEQTL